MKKIAFIIGALLIAFSIGSLKQSLHNDAETAYKPAPVEDVVTPKAAAKAPERPIKQAQAKAEEPKPPSPPASQPLTCREAIDQVWPTALRDGAKIVLEHENRSENPRAVGVENSDQWRSRDYGCFQINDHWHPDYFAGDWQDPKWAAEYALRIYTGRQAATGNGWSAWYAVQGILW